MTIRSTGFRAIERNGLRGFGLTLTIDNETPATSSRQAGAPDAGSPPTASGATLHDAWRSHGFNPDRVDR